MANKDNDMYKRRVVPWDRASTPNQKVPGLNFTRCAWPVWIHLLPVQMTIK